ncbi:Ff.00g035580.m01.CDS01 [Fusarium sp. VM40]|nr:Ff.00g035580.m01.CDS01 [Fusarium sp. VM40]
MSLDNVRPADSLHSNPEQPPSTSPSTSPPNPSELIVLRNTSTQAPNITLNRNHKATEGQLLVAACFGIILQLGVLVYFAFITYYPTLKFKKDDKDIVGYAFPLASGGTIFLVLGMLLCAHVVDHSTEEERYEPSKDHMMRMIWLQEKQTISDQAFHSFALFPRRFTQVITTSQRKKKGRTPEEYEKEASMSPGVEDKVRKGDSTVRQRARQLKASQTEKTICPEEQESPSINLCVIATLVCLMGFFVQFIGLREMHWSASVGQLVVVIIMTIIRAWIRRGFTARMYDRELRNGFELDGLALALGDPDLDKSPGSIADEKGVDFGLSKKRTWTVEINEDEEPYPIIRQPDRSTTQDTNAGALKSGLVVNRGTNEAQEILDIRRHLARLSQWQARHQERRILLPRR